MPCAACGAALECGGNRAPRGAPRADVHAEDDPDDAACPVEHGGTGDAGDGAWRTIVNEEDGAGDIADEPADIESHGLGGGREADHPDRLAGPGHAGIGDPRGGQAPPARGPTRNTLSTILSRGGSSTIPPRSGRARRMWSATPLPRAPWEQRTSPRLGSRTSGGRPASGTAPRG